ALPLRPARTPHYSTLGTFFRPIRPMILEMPDAAALAARLLPGVDVDHAKAGFAEHDLIRAAQRGDEQAFERLVRTYDQSVLRIALNLLRSPEDARDVYQ